MLFHLLDYLSTRFDFPGEALLGYISVRGVLGVLMSLTLTLVFGKNIIAWLRKKSVGETIRNLNLEGEELKTGTPTMGGVMIILFTLIPVLLFSDLTNIYIQLLIGTLIYTGIIGFIDDYIKVIKKNKKGLSSAKKILGQMVLGLVVGMVLTFHPEIQTKSEQQDPFTKEITYVVSENQYKTNVPFFKNNQLDYSDFVSFLGEKSSDWGWLIFIPIVIFVIVSVSNGANLTDGLDGLAAGTSSIVVLVLGLLAWVSGNIIAANYLNILYVPNVGEVLIFLAAFMGALIGFLWYNNYPAQVFMGDTGSLTIGAVIAVVAFTIRKELLLPLLCGVFLLENLSVMIQVFYFRYTRKKYGEGVRFFLMAPLHHHYQKKGIHEAKVVFRFLIMGLIFAVLTLLTLKLR